MESIKNTVSHVLGRGTEGENTTNNPVGHHSETTGTANTANTAPYDPGNATDPTTTSGSTVHDQTTMGSSHTGSHGISGTSDTTGSGTALGRDATSHTTGGNTALGRDATAGTVGGNTALGRDTTANTTGGNTTLGGDTTGTAAGGDNTLRSGTTETTSSSNLTGHSSGLTSGTDSAHRTEHTHTSDVNRGRDTTSDDSSSHKHHDPHEIQSPSQGPDPALVGDAKEHPKLTGQGAPGSHSAVFGLTPDGKKYEESSSKTTAARPAHSDETTLGKKSVSGASGADSGRDTVSGGHGGVSDQIDAPDQGKKGLERKDPAPISEATSGGKPGAGLGGLKQGSGEV